MFSTCFRKPEDGELACEMSSMDMLTIMQQKYPMVKIDRKSQSLLGANLSTMGLVG